MTTHNNESNSIASPATTNAYDSTTTAINTIEDQERGSLNVIVGDIIEITSQSNLLCSVNETDVKAQHHCSSIVREWLVHKPINP